MAGATGLAMFREIATFGQRLPMWTGVDFANNTWRAVRGLVAGQNVYATDAWIPGVGHVGPVAEHVPASLVWQAPFAALPLRPALLAFTFASLVAIWAGVLILTRPRGSRMTMLAVCCGAFAILAGGGPWTLFLGQPTGFALLGLALVMRARRPWVAALGLMLAASTIQVGLPLALILTVLGSWQIVWRGAVLVLAGSLPPVAAGVAKTGAAFLSSFFSGAAHFLGPTSHRIDLGALVNRAGIHSTAVQTAVGISVLVLALLFLVRLPVGQRRIDYPPVLCLIVAVILLCTYHEPYDMLLVGGAVVPATLVGARSVAMLPVFALAGVSSGLSGKVVATVVDPIFLVAMAVLSAAIATRPGLAIDAADAPGLTRRDGTASGVAVADGLMS